jgi:DNA-binding CsgD family transcriptional regulator
LREVIAPPTFERSMLAYDQSTLLFEREHETERLRARLQGATRCDGGAVVIEGTAGIGKSRLLDLTGSWGPGFGVRVLCARGTELEHGFAFGVVRQLFERPLLEAEPAQRERWLAGAAGPAGEVLARAAGSGAAGAGYAWQHGLYWLLSNLSLDSPVALFIDDLQWCDAPSVSALAFIARRLEGLPLSLFLATRPLDPALTPEAAALVADRATELLRPSALSRSAVGAFVAARLAGDADERFVGACLDVTGGNPFLLGELLSEARARGLEPTSADAGEVGELVPRGVANAVRLRLARLTPDAMVLARALCTLGDGAQVGDAAELAGLAAAELEDAMAELVFAGVIESRRPVRFTHPILRAAIYDDLSPAERARQHGAAAAILRARRASPGQVAAQLMHTEPAGDPVAAALLREAAHAALALGDAAGAAALLSRARAEPPADGERGAVVFELGQALARAGAPEAIEPLTEIVEHGEDPGAVAAAAIDLSGKLFLSGRPAEGAAILGRARERIPDDLPAREQLDVALLGVSYTSGSARREVEAAIAGLRDPGGPARSVLEATALATLALDEVMYLGSAPVAIDRAERALAAGLPLELHRGQHWGMLALAALMLSDSLDAALDATGAMLAHARRHGAAATVVALAALRALIGVRRGDVACAQADAELALELAADLLGAEYLVLAVASAVLAGLEAGQTPGSLRRLIDGAGVRGDTDFVPSTQLRYASGVLYAAAGDHEAAVEELRGCGFGIATFGGENPSVLAWRSAAALSLAELGRRPEAQALAEEEVRRARAFGAPRALGIALRAEALVGPPAERTARLQEAVEVLAASPARLEHARALVGLGASLRAAGRRKEAREPLLEGLALAARCSARTLTLRARSELAALGLRPRTTDHAGPDSLTPSERRVVVLAAAGASNREIGQELFVTEKTVETHLGRAFRKLDVTSRRQLPDALAGPA